MAMPWSGAVQIRRRVGLRTVELTVHETNWTPPPAAIRFATDFHKSIGYVFTSDGKSGGREVVPRKKALVVMYGNVVGTPLQKHIHVDESKPRGVGEKHIPVDE